VETGTAFGSVLAAAQQGDPQACAELWRRYAPAVASYARARGSQEPDDLTSEVFLAVFRQLPRFAGDEPAFKGFLFTIAHRRLVDELRRRSRQPARVAWTEESDTRSTGSAEEGALRTISRAEAREMLDGLAPDQRDVLVLRMFGDLTVDQIATVLGKRVGAVKALQRRGLEALRRNLADGRTPAGLTDDRRG
jgi:RNA polymerase sigma factor (sigma-70 family)